MHFSLLALISVAFAAVQVTAKEPPTRLQIGIKQRNPDPNCVKSKDGDMLAVHYTGRLWEDGKEFDSSLTRDEPFMFPLGKGQVIAGWEQGMRGMCVGEKRKLVIPASLGYGSKGAPGFIPPDAALVFETELISINGQGKHDEL
ncbi:Peptidyl-prolyl cis-trans isomerase fpr2 [Actinomortierella wolfii]|nr:Peptidyl-prolyl cis-trans isomerase fpr2 [Actinomortierella wolfii]